MYLVTYLKQAVINKIYCKFAAIIIYNENLLRKQKK